MIELCKSEKRLILLIKGQLQDEFPFTGSWPKTLSPFCIELFGWDANEDNNYNDYLRSMFNLLLKLYTKIEFNQSGDPLHYISGIFYASFNKSISRDSDLPIERAISELCGLIQCNTVIDKGIKRYDLDKL